MNESTNKPATAAPHSTIKKIGETETHLFFTLDYGGKKRFISQEKQFDFPAPAAPKHPLASVDGPIAPIIAPFVKWLGS